MTDRKSYSIGPVENYSPVYPWYKERLLTKCLKDAKNKQKLSGALDGRRWRFLNRGLDDFRDGYPTVVGDEETFTPTQRDTSPAIFGITSPTSCHGKPPKKRFTKEQTCFSKQNPLQQAHREHVDAVEYTLTQHPLALYPHLENGMPPELFDRVLSVLDPDMYVKRESAMTSPEKENKQDSDECVTPYESTTLESPESEAERGPPSITTMPEEEVPRDKMAGNPYKWQDAKESSAKEDQTLNLKGLCSPSQDKDIKKVTKLFCDWVISLGGKSNNLTESTLLGLFVSGSEKKPSLAFPIDVIEPNSIPDELRASVKDRCRDYMGEDTLKDSALNRGHTASKKSKYGAWYLDPKTWKKRVVEEPLRDLSVIVEDVPEQPSERDEELRQIHGTQAFKQFIISNGLRVPRFLCPLFTEEEQENRARGADTAGSVSARKGAEKNAVL